MEDVAKNNWEGGDGRRTKNLQTTQTCPRIRGWMKKSEGECNVGEEVGELEAAKGHELHWDGQREVSGQRERTEDTKTHILHEEELNRRRTWTEDAQTHEQTENADGGHKDSHSTQGWLTRGEQMEKMDGRCKDSHATWEWPEELISPRRPREVSRWRCSS